MAVGSHPTLHGLVSEAASRHPSNRAVVFDDGEDVTGVLTYDKMQEAAGCIRSRLCHVGCGEGQVVGLYYEPSVMLPSCILGILQTGASFAPVDPRAPRNINDYFISSLNLLWVLLPESHEKAFIQMYGQTFKAQPTENSVILGDVSFRLVKLSANQKPHSRSRSPGVHLAYAMHTSGTTGMPKTVRVRHRCIVPNVTDLSAIFSISPDDIIFMASPLTFDPSIVEMFLALSNGASLLMVPDAVKVVPRRLMEVLLRNQVSILQATPTLISRFGRDLLRQSLFSSNTRLRILAFGGETCPTLAQINHMRAADNATTKFYNIYGITEVSSWASCYQIDVQGKTEEAYESIPLGKPLLDTTLEVRNENGQTIMEGEGQLFIGSDSRVCLLDGETWPVPSGKRGVMRASGDRVSITDRGLVFTGRHSDQVKRNGKRFSLSQVKQRIETLQVIESCKLLLIPHDELLLFCVPRLVDRKSDPSPSSSSTIADEESLRGLLKDALPSHCLPDKIYFLERFPLTSHGKVDRNALLRQASEVDGLERTAQGQCEGGRMQKGELAVLWKKASSSSSTEPLDATLFVQHSGGDSFQAVQLANAVESWTGQRLPNLLDVILHRPFIHVLEHIQSNFNEDKHSHTDETNVKGTATDSLNGFVTATRGSEKFQRTDEMTLFRDGKTPDFDSANINLSSVETHGSDLGLKTESQFQRFSKRRKLLITSDVETNKTTNKTINEDSALEIDSESSDENRPNVINTNPELCFSPAVTQLCCCGLKNSHEISKVHCDLCTSTTVQDCHISTQNATHDVSNDAYCVKYTIRRCSQSAATQPQTAHCTDYNPLSDTLNQESEKAVARGSQTDHTHHRGSVSLHQRWRYDTGKCVDASPLLVTNSRLETVIYIGSHSHKFAAISMATGKALWVTELGDRVESSACLSACGSKVIVGCYDNCLYTLDADSGTIQWKFKTNGPIKSSPVADHSSSLVYVGSHDQNLYALDIQEPTCKWCLHCGGGSVFSSPVVHDPSATVYVATLAGLLVAVNKETGAEKWSFNCGKPVFSSPMASWDSVLLGCVDGNLYCINHSGKELWRFSTSAPIFSSSCVPPFAQPSVAPNMAQRSIRPSVADSCVVFGSHDHHIYCLSLRSGELRWRHKMPSTVYASPFIFKNKNLCPVVADNCHTGCGEHSTIQLGYVHAKSDKTAVHKRVATRDSAHHCTPCHPRRDSIIKHGCQDRLFVAVCSTDGTVVTLDLMSGEVITSCRLPGEVFSSPIVFRDHLVVGCRDNYVYFLEIC